MHDPASIITAIGVGLKLVDQFRELVLRWHGKPAPVPSASAEQEGNAIKIKQSGQVVQQVTASQLRFGALDEVRYKALEERIRLNWQLFHALYSQMPTLSIDEQARINLRMERIKGELCQDFRGMVRMYEDLLGVSLPDHYSLFEVCSQP